MIGVRSSSFGRAKRSTSLAGPPSTLTEAIPIPLPRLPIHRTEVPVKVNETVAPTTVDCTAAPPLHPPWGLLCIHPALRLTAAASDSSKRAVAGAVVVPPPLGGLPAGGLPLGVPGLPPLGVPGLPAVVVVGLVPPLVPSPPPPPHEISMAASNRTPTRSMQRFIHNLSVGIVWVSFGHKRV